MGIVRRAYIFICLVGVMSTICIVLLSVSNKHPYKVRRRGGDRQTGGWHQPWKPDTSKSHRDSTDAQQYLRTSKQLERTADNEGAVFSAKFSLSADRRTNRNTASIKENVAPEGVTESNMDIFSVLEDNSLRPVPNAMDGSPEVETDGGDAVAILMNISRKPTTPGKQSSQRVTSVDKALTAVNWIPTETGGETAARHVRHEVLMPRNHKTSPVLSDTPMNLKEPALSVTLSPKNIEMQMNRLMHVPNRRNPEVRRLSKTFPDGDAKDPQAKASSGETGKQRRVDVDESRAPSPDQLRVVEDRDMYLEHVFQLGPQIQPISLNQSLLDQSNLSELALSKTGGTRERILVAGHLRPGACQPQNNMVMLKTHKCSSSTLQNILFRWGDDHNLTFVLPRSGPYIGHPQPFDINLAERVIGDKYNILANHARYNREGLKRAMPSDTVYFTVLRDPVKQFESAFTYYKFDERYGVTGLRAFLKQPEIYFQREPVYPRQAGHNQMLYDLGLDARFMDETTPEVRDYITMLEANFQLVMIAEHFEESLILLKDMLCWSLGDIVYFNQNARSKSSVRRITPSMRRDILDWNAADAAMYEHFNRTLWAKIEAYGRQRMREEVAQLRAWNEALKKKCIGGKMESHDPRMWYPPGIKVDSFVLNPDAHGQLICEQLIRPELAYIDLLKAKQRRAAPQANWKQEFMRRQAQMRDAHARKFINFRPERII